MENPRPRWILLERNRDRKTETGGQKPRETSAEMERKWVTSRPAWEQSARGTALLSK